MLSIGKREKWRKFPYRGFRPAHCLLAWRRLGSSAADWGHKPYSGVRMNALSGAGPLRDMRQQATERESRQVGITGPPRRGLVRFWRMKNPGFVAGAGGRSGLRSSAQLSNLVLLASCSVDANYLAADVWAVDHADGSNLCHIVACWLAVNNDCPFATHALSLSWRRSEPVAARSNREITIWFAGVLISHDDCSSITSSMRATHFRPRLTNYRFWVFCLMQLQDSTASRIGDGATGTRRKDFSRFHLTRFFQTQTRANSPADYRNPRGFRVRKIFPVSKLA